MLGVTRIPQRVGTQLIDAQGRRVCDFFLPARRHRRLVTSPRDDPRSR